MQINRIGVGLLLFFGIVGAGLVVVPPAVGAEAMLGAILAIIGGFCVVVVLGFALYARRQVHRAAHQDWIFRNGIKGTATIVDAGSHATVNDMPLMKLKLDLDVRGVGVQQVTHREVMPVFTAQRMRPGLVLTAYFNPADPGDFILVW